MVGEEKNMKGKERRSGTRIGIDRKIPQNKKS